MKEDEMSEKFKKALRIAVNVGCGFEADAEDAAELLTLITGLESRIAELEAENETLKTACDILRKQNQRLFSQVFSDGKPELNVCKACGGDGTVLLTDGYEGQVIATAECIYCNGTGRVSKESEE